MKVLFIYPNIGQVVQYNHGIASLSATLKAAGHKTSLLILRERAYIPLKKKISSFAPDVICFSIVSNYWNLSCLLARDIKRDFTVKIFAGGMHCSIFPESYTIDSPFDGICRGEGEEALLELAGRMQLQKPYYDVKNFWFKKDGGLIKNDIRSLIQDLDTLPFPDRDIFPSKIYEAKRFIFTRGCPFDCSYCSNKAYRDLIKGKGKIIRFRSVDKAIEEIKDCVETYNPKTLAFDDDSFNKNHEWFEEFVTRYKRGHSFPPFGCNTRPELIAESSIKLFKEANCRQINIGIESGDPNIRSKVLNRQMSDEQIINAFTLAKKYGIETYSFNMIGIPGETINNFKKTIQLNQLIQPDKLQISIFYPYPGTKLGDVCREKGFLNKGDVYSYFYQSCLMLPDFSRRRILINKLLFQFNVYKVKSIIKAFYFLYRDIREYLEYRNKVWTVFFNTLLTPVRFIRRRLKKNDVNLAKDQPHFLDKKFFDLISSKGWKQGRIQYIRDLDPSNVYRFAYNCDELRQGAWKFFLDISSDKNILNIETELGGSSILLTRNASKVYCLHHSEDLAQCIAKRAESLDIANLETLVGKTIPHLPFADSFFDIVALHKADNIIKSYFNSGDYYENLNILLKELSRVLRANGTLYISGNKKSQIDGGISNFHFIKKKILNQNFRLEKLMTHLPGFERTYFVKEYSSNNSFVHKLLNYIDFSRRDNFALILNRKKREKHRSFIANLIDLIKSETGEKKLGFIKLELSTINSSLLIHTNKFIIRMPNSEDAYKRCRNSFRTLKKLNRFELPFKVPEVVTEGSIDKCPYFVETRIKGTPFKYWNKNISSQKVQIIGNDALSKLIDFHVATAEEAVIDDSHFKRLIEKPIDELSLYSLPQELSMLDELKVYLYEKFINKSQRLICSHGDYQMGNILCDRHNKVVGVVDWELSGYPDLPYIDFVRFYACEKTFFTKKPAPESIYELIWNGPDHFLLKKYLSKMGIDEYEIGLYGLIALIYCLVYQESHEESRFSKKWHEDKVNNILLPAYKKIMSKKYT